MEIKSISAPSFGRKPTLVERRVCASSVKDGLKLLNKQFDLILHNASAPSISRENTGIGSLFSRTVQTKLMPFLKLHGITGIQQEPAEFRKASDPSPYAPEANTKNIFMIPLEKLASFDYDHILSKKTLASIVADNPNKRNVDYDYVRKSYDIALREAFANSKGSKEFAEFKNAHADEYEKPALFRILDKHYNGKTWSELDLNLYSTTSEEAKNRINELKNTYKDEYYFYIFNQMLLEKETKKSNELSKELGIKIIGDSPVAQSAVDEWVHKDLFLKGKAIGCPPDYYSKEGQRWGFKYYDPEKIFNKDGSLGEVGEILKAKYERYFENFSGGIRIDHVIGLIDPFIYDVASKKMTAKNSGRIFSQKGGKYEKHSVEEFAQIFEKIIIPAAEKNGLKKSDIICEDLGEKTPMTAAVMERLNLGGIGVTQFNYRGANIPEQYTLMPGSHDNVSFLEYTDNLFKTRQSKEFLKKTKWLANDTIAKDSSIDQKEKYLRKIRNNKSEFIKASFAELFTSPARRIQMFFTDFWGIPKTYNRPGTETGNWSLRVGEDFENDYYKAVKEGKAPNIPELIAIALRHRGLDKNNPELMKDLNKSAGILRE